MTSYSQGIHHPILHSRFHHTLHPCVHRVGLDFILLVENNSDLKRKSKSLYVFGLLFLRVPVIIALNDSFNVFELVSMYFFFFQKSVFPLQILHHGRFPMYARVPAEQINTNCNCTVLLLLLLIRV